MTREEFTALGKKTFGDWGWKAKIARELDVNYRTVQRWEKGELALPIKIMRWLELRAAAAEVERNKM
jgi:hypothetical protein